MKRCNKGKSCGSTCINRGDKCQIELNEQVSKNLTRISGNLRSRDVKQWAGNVVEGLFGVRPKLDNQSSNQKPKDQLVLEDISRLLRGEEPKYISLTRDNKSKGLGEVSRLQSALGMGQLTRQEVGRDWQVLKEEALRRKDELRAEIKRQRVLGTQKARVKEKALQAELDKLNLALKAGEGQKAPVSSSTKDARIGAKYFDESFSPEKTVSGKANDYDWEQNARKGTNGKRGGFGSVLFDGDNVVKRGDLGERELEVLKKVGEADVGPRLIYGELGKRKEFFAGVGIHEGRVAMSKVPGSEVGSFSSPGEKIGNTTAGDSYWAARASLHRLGVAHNDAHGGNVIVDDFGKPRFVDFGLSQDNPKAAMSEALSAIVNRTVLPPGATIKGGMRTDVQAGKVANSGISMSPAQRPANLRKMYANLAAVKTYLRKLGMSNDDIAQVMASGIRNPESFYNKEAWGKLSNENAMKVIGILYDGI